MTSCDINTEQYGHLPPLIVESCLPHSYEQCESSSLFYFIRPSKRTSLSVYLSGISYKIVYTSKPVFFVMRPKYFARFLLILVRDRTLIFRSLNIDAFVRYAIQSILKRPLINPERVHSLGICTFYTQGFRPVCRYWKNKQLISFILFCLLSVVLFQVLVNSLILLSHISLASDVS